MFANSMMKINLCKLRNIGILQDNGKIVSYPELNNKQSLYVIKCILEVINNQDIDEYLEMNMNAGRTMYKPFPNCVVYKIIDDNKVELKELIMNNMEDGHGHGHGSIDHSDGY
jgi:hypothetical protein